MHTQWKDILKAAFSEHPTAVRLARAAEAGGVVAEVAAIRPDLLSPQGLDPEDVGPLDIRHAQQLANAHSAALGRYARPKSQSDLRSAADAGLAPLNREPEGRKRDTVLGFPATAVVRWMGKEEWTPQKADTALRALGLDMNKGTLYAQLAAGRKGERGAPAALSPAQQQTLEDAADSKNG